MNVERATYTVAEAAQRTGVSYDTILRRCKAGEIPARRIGQRWVIPIDLFEGWLRTPTTEAAS